MKKLDQLRKKIDIIDDKILKLLQNRSKLALDIGSLKNKNSKSSNLFRPERQAKILSRLFLKKNSLFNEKDISNFWKEIFFHVILNYANFKPILFINFILFSINFAYKFYFYRLPF